MDCVVYMRYLFLPMIGLVTGLSYVVASPLSTLLPNLVNIDPRIQAAQHNVEINAQGIPQARAAWLPQLTLNSYIGSQQRFLPDPINNTSYGDNRQVLQLSQLIYDFGRTGASIDSAHQKYRQSLVTYVGTIQDVLLSGITSYINLYRTYHALLYANRYVTNVQKQVDMETKRKNNGLGYETDVLEAQAQLSDAQARQVLANGQLALQKNSFERLFQQRPTHIPDYTLPQDSTKLIPNSSKQAIATALLNNTDIRALEYNVMIAKQTIRRQKGNFFPIVTAVVEGRHLYNVNGFEGRRLDYVEKAEINYPLISGFGDLASYRASKFNLERTLSELDNERLKIRQRVQDDWEQLTIARDYYQKTSKQTEQLARFVRLATKSRQLGQKTLLEVLVADSNFINAADASVNALAQLYIARFNLIRDMNILTLNSLKVVIGPYPNQQRATHD